MQLYDINGLPIKHYGVKGQCWGYRRYQNQDGTLTLEGKIRYYKASKNSINRALTRGAARVYTTPQLITSSVKNAAVSILPPIGKARKLKEAVQADYRDIKDIREGVRTRHIVAGREFVDVEGAAVLHFRNEDASLLEYRKTKLDGLNRIIANAEYDSKEYRDLIKERDILVRDIERNTREMEEIEAGRAKVREIVVNLF